MALRAVDRSGSDPFVSGRDAGFASRAVARLSLIEFWERYSFYTTFALLALFVAAPLARGGLGWAGPDTLRFFGAYLFVVQAAPLAGGLVADRWLGKRRALQVGAAALALGHGALACAAALPVLAGDGPGRTLAAAAAAAGVPLGRGLDVAALPSSYASPAMAVTVLFYAAIGLIAVGNALFKPILTVAIGRLPFADDRARGAAFTTFFRYINIGGLLSVALGGWLAERFGWSFAFGGSALGMLVAIATMATLDRRYVRPFLTPEADAAPADSAEAAEFLKPLALLLALVVVCASFSYQSYGFISLFTEQFVARGVGGYTIPPPWFTALNPITIMILSQLLLALWRRGGPGARWTTAQRIAAALIVMAFGFAPLGAAAAQAAARGMASPLWVAAAIVFIAASELLYAPAVLHCATRIAPRRLQTVAVGSQGLAVGVGGWLSGQLGAAAMEGDKAAVMSGVAVTALVVGVAIYRGDRWFARFGL